MITTAMGLVANMSLMQAITEKVPQGTCGFVSFLLVVARALLDMKHLEPYPLNFEA